MLAVAMAPRKKPSVRGIKPLPPGAALRHSHNDEVREAVGMSGLTIANLQERDIRELATTYLIEGLDGLQSKYGLTRGELVELIVTPAFSAAAVAIAEAQRIQVVTRSSFSLSRLLAKLERMALQDDANVGVVLDAIETAKRLMVEVGGIEQRLVIRHGFDEAPGTARPQAPAMMPSELGKLQQLQQQLEALASAGVDLREGATQLSEEKPDEHSGLRGSG